MLCSFNGLFSISSVLSNKFDVPGRLKWICEAPFKDNRTDCIVIYKYSSEASIMLGSWIAQTPTLILAQPSCQPSEEEAGGSRGKVVTKNRKPS